MHTKDCIFVWFLETLIKILRISDMSAEYIVAGAVAVAVAVAVANIILNPKTKRQAAAAPTTTPAPSI
jgi:hypothetical protein